MKNKYFGLTTLSYYKKRKLQEIFDKSSISLALSESLFVELNQEKAIRGSHIRRNELEDLEGKLKSFAERVESDYTDLIKYAVSTLAGMKKILDYFPKLHYQRLPLENFVQIIKLKIEPEYFKKADFAKLQLLPEYSQKEQFVLTVLGYVQKKHQEITGLIRAKASTDYIKRRRRTVKDGVSKIHLQFKYIDKIASHVKFIYRTIEKCEDKKKEPYCLRIISMKMHNFRRLISEINKTEDGIKKTKAEMVRLIGEKYL